MNATLRRRFEMAIRVRDFLRVHPTNGVAEGTALARLEELLKREQVLAAQQRAGVVASRASTEQRAGVRRALQSKLLKYLAAVGAVAAKENIELGAQFRLPLHASNHAFLTVAQGMLEKATAEKALLVSRGMSETLLDDLAVSIAEFDQTLQASRAGRRDHVGAGADLREVAREIREQVRVLDGLVAYRFGDNAELMAAWASARNVEGPFRSHTEEKPAGGEAPGVVAAA